jgi:hypothetical protein
MIRRLALAILPVAAALLCTGGGKKAQSFLITFHVEGVADEAPEFASPVKMGTEMRQYYFRKVPEFTDQDIEWFHPFISQDGQTYGAAFKLNGNASQQLKALCLTHAGKLLGARIANAPYSAVMIDRPVDDGVLVVWQGLGKAHLKAFEKKFRHSETAAPAGREQPDPTSLYRQD